MSVKVSVIIPVYNCESYIGQAIQSALDQTEKDLEVIVVDDGSTDQTCHMIRGFTDSRVRLLAGEQNAGESRARNLGVAHAKGQWIAFLDGDDWWAPQRLERLLGVAEKEEADIIMDNCRIIDDGARYPWKTARRVIRFEGIVRLDAVRFVAIDPGVNLIVRRRFLVEHEIRFDEGLIAAPDMKYGLQCIIRGGKFVVVPQAYYFYRRRPGQVTGQSLISVIAMRKLTSALLRDVEVCADPELCRALARRLEFLKREESYQRVAQPVKEGKYWAAFRELLRQPEKFSVIVERLPRVFRRQSMRALWRLRELLGSVLWRVKAGSM